jgi:hypothetical protein
MQKNYPDANEQLILKIMFANKKAMLSIFRATKHIETDDDRAVEDDGLADRLSHRRRRKAFIQTSAKTSVLTSPAY